MPPGGGRRWVRGAAPHPRRWRTTAPPCAASAAPAPRPGSGPHNRGSWSLSAPPPGAARGSHRHRLSSLPAEAPAFISQCAQLEQLPDALLNPPVLLVVERSTAPARASLEQRGEVIATISAVPGLPPAITTLPQAQHRAGSSRQASPERPHVAEQPGVAWIEWGVTLRHGHPNC